VARARGHSPFETSAEQDALLDRILDVARSGGEGTVGVFDLDGCLFDNRPRQIHIFRELASQAGIHELYDIGLEHFQDWSLRGTLARAGLNEARIQEIHDRVQDHWRRHFFRSEYVLYDHAMPGAPELVWACYRTGMHVVYLTGRDDQMRAGTEEALLRFGFPYQRPRSTLVTKRDVNDDDTAFKGEALREVMLLGRPHLFLDNEPANVNLFREKHPAAFVVFVETDHSDRPDEPHPDIPWIRSFLRSGRTR
jgi:hypothetical protein